MKTKKTLLRKVSFKAPKCIMQSSLNQYSFVILHFHRISSGVFLNLPRLNKAISFKRSPPVRRAELRYSFLTIFSFLRYTL